MPLLGQHRNRRCAASLIFHRQCSRIGNLSQRALARTRPLDLGDHSDPRASEARHRINRSVDVLAALLQPLQRNTALTDRKILPDSRENVI